MNPIQVPSQLPFSTSIDLGGQHYTLELSWNIYAQRMYFGILDHGSYLYYSPLISSPDGQVAMIPDSFFGESIYYDESSGFLL